MPMCDWSSDVCSSDLVEGVFTAMNSSRSLAGPVHGPHCVCSSHLPCVCGQALWPEQLCAQLSLFLACSTSLFFCIVSSAIITDLLSSCFLLLFLLLALSRGLVCCHMLLLHHAHPHPWLGRRSALGLKAPSLELGCLGLIGTYPCISARRQAGHRPQGRGKTGESAPRPDRHRIL